MTRFILGALAALFIGSAHAETCQNANTCGQVVYAGPRVGNSVPTAVAGVGAGSTGTATIAGHDQSGSIQIVTSGTAPSTGIIATLTFSTTWTVGTTGTAPFCEVYPANAAAAALAIGAWPYPTSTSTTLVLNSGGTALANSATYIWNYLCL